MNSLEYQNTLLSQNPKQVDFQYHKKLATQCISHRYPHEILKTYLLEDHLDRGMCACRKKIIYRMVTPVKSLSFSFPLLIVAKRCSAGEDCCICFSASSTTA